MDTTRRKLVPATFMAADSVVLIASLCLAAASSPVFSDWSSLRDLLDVRPRLLDIAMAGGMVIVWLVLFSRFGLYRERYLSFMRLRTYHFIDLLKAVSLGTLLLVGAVVLADLPDVDVLFVLTFWVTSLVGTALLREGLIWLLCGLRLHGRNLRHLLIVGTNARALEFADKIERRPELGYRLRGFVDDRRNRHAPALGPGDDKLVANFDTIGAYLKDNVVDEVVIALPLATLYDQASRIVKICEEHGIVVHFVPGFDFLNVGSSRATFETLDDEPVITLLPPAMSGWQVGVKRVVDIIAALTAIVVLAPLFLIVAVLVKLTSPGPVLFVQERLGLCKRRFRLLKFRTMTSDAEKLQEALEDRNEAGGPVFKIHDDPRITPLGAFLRRTSLDELPQLFNVLRGDMSLVGPRPLPLRDYAGFDQDWHRRRFSVRPGITCLWQVSGRSSVSFDRWMELDMEYINHWSLWLDLKILAKTLPAVLARRGAF
jgi:exopolysaccharide biosynthesis polyprenyl glycosylphosphotransferase